jgi:sulfatase modifying factor 1
MMRLPMPTSTAWAHALSRVALLTALAGCSYHRSIPDGVISCGNKQREACPAGFECAPLPGDPFVHVCTRPGSPSMDAAAPPKDTREPAKPDAPPPDAATPAPPDVPVALDASPDRAAPVDLAAVDEDAAPDLGRPDQASADAADAAPAACPPSKGGPRLMPAGKFCVDESEVTNEQYRTFLDSVVRSDLKLPTECAAKVGFIPESSPEVLWNDQRPANFPVVNVDWCDAWAFCAWAGKHMCGKIGGGVLPMTQAGTASTSQWASACSREGTRLYPYGAAGAGMCNTRKPRMPIAFGAVKSYPGCEGGYPGVFDLVGNVEEWADACAPSSTKGGDCAVVGGAFAPESENPDCLSWFAGHRLDHYFRRGFRCCAN